MNFPSVTPTPPHSGALHLLLVEDNADIVANLFAFLEPLGYSLDTAPSGPVALALAREQSYDVIVLDLKLPGMDGIQVCQELRRTLRRSTPVLMLTARDTDQDKVAGFGAGADDYVVKPFSLVELDVRLRALHRRASSRHVGAVLSAGDLRLDMSTYSATRCGMPLRLTPTGLKLLAALLRVSPQVVTRADLERELWGDSPPNSDALRTHMHALRLAVDKPFRVPLVRTLPGIGYCLDARHAS